MTNEELIEALTTLKEQAQYYGDNTFVWSINIDSFKFVIDSTIKALEQEPRKGHWEHGKELGKEYLGRILVDVTYENWHCSNCHCVIEQSIKPKWNFCPNCGADMR